MNKQQRTGYHKGRYIHIQDVERDIYNGMTSEALANKYNVPEEEIIPFIRKEYSNNPNKIRDILRRLKSSDEQEAMRMARSKSVATGEKKKPVEEVRGKTNTDEQRMRVRIADEELHKATSVLNEASGKLKRAENVRAEAQVALRQAQDALSRAEKAKDDADDAVRHAQNVFASAEDRVKMCKKKCGEEEARLQELLSIPKLYDAFALKKVKDCLEGVIYVSKWDYDTLIDDATKYKVIPVDTSDVKLKAYPDNFYTYPIELGMEKYRSACEFALAYCKMFKEFGETLEVHCAEQLVRELAFMQVDK